MKAGQSGKRNFWKSCNCVFHNLQSDRAKNLPWLNKKVMQAIRKRDALFKKAKRCKNPIKYRAARNRVTAMIRLNKLKFFQSLKGSDSKAFWKAIMNNRETTIPTLVYNDSLYETNCDKANVLNCYFHQCFNKDVPALNPQPTILDPLLFPQEYSCTEDEVYDLITELDVSKSTGTDDILVKCSRLPSLLL